MQADLRQTCYTALKMAASARHLLTPWTRDSELSPEQKELQELKTVRPIKVALSSDTSSPFSDPLMSIYGSFIITLIFSKFINMMMQDGSKILARGIMTQTLETIKRKQVEKYHKSPAAKREEIECSPHSVFQQALENCKPIIGLASVQKGGKSYQG